VSKTINNDEIVSFETEIEGEMIIISYPKNLTELLLKDITDERVVPEWIET